MEFRRSEQIQTTLPLYSDVRLSPVIYQDAGNGKQKLKANSNDNNFFLESPIEYRHISRCSKFKTEAPSKFK